MQLTCEQMIGSPACWKLKRSGSGQRLRQAQEGASLPLELRFSCEDGTRIACLLQACSMLPPFSTAHSRIRTLIHTHTNILTLTLILALTHTLPSHPHPLSPSPSYSSSPQPSTLVISLVQHV